VNKKADQRRAKREKSRKKLYAQQKHQEHYGPAPPPKPPTKFTTPYGADFLQHFGPLLKCGWGIPQALAAARKSAGQAETPRIHGALLLDTGASGTCISVRAAQKLGLVPTRMQKGFGAAGEHDAPVFFANLEITIADPVTQLGSLFGWEQEVQGVPDLEKCVPGLAVDGQPMEVVGLLGRDILRHAKINYDGPKGVLTFEFDVASLQGKPSR